MKFHQRLGMLSSVTGLAILYLLLVYSQGVVHMPSVHPAARHRRRALLMDYEFDQQSWRTAYQPHQCSSDNTDITGADNHTIFTIDLPKRTNYKAHGNKHYVFPYENSAADPDSERLNVVIVPYSHVDAGWLRTVEEYYVNHVKGILNNMVVKLSRYEEMKFVWAETVFLSMWWNELDDDVKHKTRLLIERGQLEIVLGGWVMSDEASTHYVSVLDQLMEGHQWVAENLKTKPINSWAIDPFGHSATMPYLWQQSGIENMVIQRVHQAIKATLATQKALEFNWRQLWDAVGDTDILCHVMPYLYYGIQHSCGPDRQICAMYDYGIPKSILEQSTGREITDKNIQKQATHLYDQFRRKANLFRYNTVLIPLGDDFRFDTSKEWDLHYDNYMKVMEYINSRRDWNMNVQFGTLKTYFNLVRKEETKSSHFHSNTAFPVLKGDFFPYSDLDSDYWTGYYSTRPFQKQLSRDIESNLRSADILTTLAHAQCKRYKAEYENYLDIMSKLQEVRRSLGLFLHHDAITGTSKPDVVQDYENKLLMAYNTSQAVMSATIQNLLTKCSNDDPVVLGAQNIRHNENTPPTKYKTLVTEFGTKVFFFNPIAQERSEFVSLKVDTVNIDIRNSQNLNIPFQINPVFKHTTKIQKSEFEVVFLVELPPFAIETITLVRVESPQYNYWSAVETYYGGNVDIPESCRFQYAHSDNIAREISIGNDIMDVKFNKNGLLSGVYYKQENHLMKMKLEFLAYKSHASGAYLFYPAGEAKNILEKTTPLVRVIKGPFMEQIQVVYKHLHHSISVFDTPTVQGQGLHVENVLDMSAETMKNQEVIMRLNSDVNNLMGRFYTDENGFQLMGRETRHNARVETNYYPVTTMALLEDERWRMTVHMKQSHGCASLHQGELEFMLDRHVDNDDNRGLGEGVTDNRPTVSNFILQFEHKQSHVVGENSKFTYPSIVSHIINDHLQQPLQSVFTTMRNTEFLSRYYHPTNQTMPCDYTVVSFKNLVTSDLIYNGSSVTIHRRGFSCQFPVSGLQCSLDRNSVNIGLMFPKTLPVDIRETTLTHLHSKSNLALNADIHLKAMELQSFIVSL